MLDERQRRKGERNWNGRFSLRKQGGGGEEEEDEENCRKKQ
jgi:hypothetical protein